MSDKNKEFKVKSVYVASNGKKFKCLSVDSVKATFAPIRGCVVFAKKAFARKLRVNLATKCQCVKVNGRGDFVWLSV